MILHDVTIKGFKKIKEQTRLRINTKVVALIGGNEAGKTSVLQALHTLSDDSPIDPKYISRGLSPADCEIKATFLLPENNKPENFPNGQYKFILIKRGNGTRLYDIDPGILIDSDRRKKLIPILNTLISNTSKTEEFSVATGQFKKFRDFLEKNMNSVRKLNTSELIDAIELMNNQDYDDYDDDYITYINNTIEQISNFIEEEQADTPHEDFLKRFVSEVPSFLLFDEEQRNLNATYSVEDIAEGLDALDNLLDLANADKDELQTSLTSSDNVSRANLERTLNRNLQNAFKDAWSQSKITFAFRLLPNELQIYADNDSSEFTDIAERSDGLRQFVALQAFVRANWSKNPILLIDEAEYRLHYDAQADLVQMFAKQNLASKIIYTTHSAGCLPEDLGKGVCLVRQNDISSSQLDNRFWSQKSNGVVPLLYGLGASTMAFFPTRHSLIVEGASDMILIPTLFREALQIESLGFQTVPGLAEDASLVSLVGANSEIRTLYLLDGDNAGQKIITQLLNKNISNEKIFSLNDVEEHYEVEDLIDKKIIIRSINSLIDRYHAGKGKLSDDFDYSKFSEIKNMYEKEFDCNFPKVDFAYNVLEHTDVNQSILSSETKKKFTALTKKIMDQFKNNSIDNS